MRDMTAHALQDALLKEITDILKDIRTENTAGEAVDGIKGYAQQLPEITEDDTDASQLFPYFIVRLSDGNTAGDEEPWIITVNILLGAYDKDKSGRGFLHVLHMIQRITDRFAAEPLLKKRFRAEPDMSWALQEEDTYPFYFGGVEIKFSVMKIGRRRIF